MIDLWKGRNTQGPETDPPPSQKVKHLLRVKWETRRVGKWMG